MCSIVQCKGLVVSDVVNTRLHRYPAPLQQAASLPAVFCSNIFVQKRGKIMHISVLADITKYVVEVSKEGSENAYP